jgi:hypothetical protein
MPPVPTSSDPMGGRLSVEINGVTIPSFMLGGVSANVTQILRTSERLSGTATTPTNMLDNPSYDITFFPNKWSDLQFFMPDNMDGTAFVLGSQECSIPDTTEVVLHYECEDDTTRDITIPVARVSFEDSSERTQTDDLSVMIHIYPQPNALGQIIYGSTGS